MTDKQERRLLSRLKKGDTDALSEMIDSYSAYVCAIISNVFRGSLPSEDVEECASDVFVAVWYHCDSIKSGSLKPYIASTARNKARSRLRSLRCVEPLEDDFPILSCDEPEAKALGAELALAARQAVDSLPEPDREIFQRHYFLYQTSEAIAASLRMNDATVRTRLRRGREKLRSYLVERGYDCETIYL